MAHVCLRSRLARPSSIPARLLAGAAPPQPRPQSLTPEKAKPLPRPLSSQSPWRTVCAASRLGCGRRDGKSGFSVTWRSAGEACSAFQPPCGGARDIFADLACSTLRRVQGSCAQATSLKLQTLGFESRQRLRMRRCGCALLQGQPLSRPHAGGAGAKAAPARRTVRLVLCARLVAPQSAQC